MPQTEIMRKTDFQRLVKCLRNPMEFNKQLPPDQQLYYFEDVAKKFWCGIGIDGEFSLLCFEAFVIEVISRRISSFKENDDETNASQHDRLLLMFGLLDGYYHTDHKQGRKYHISVQKRREKYLAESDYVAIAYKDKPPKNFSPTDRNSAPWKQINKFESRETSDSDKDDPFWSYFYGLYTTGKFQKIMDAGIKHFIIEDENGRRVNYPEPIFTLENFPIEPKTTALEEKVADQEVSTNVAEDIGETVPIKQKKLKATNWISILCAVLCVICLLAIPVVNSMLADDGQVIQDIDVAQSQINLYPGGSERLKIYTAPEDADMDGLECHSDSSPLITADKSNDWVDTNPWTEAWRVAAEKNWTEIFPYNAKVSVMGGDAIPVYVDITVEQPSYIESTDVLTGNNANDGTGEKTDITP